MIIYMSTFEKLNVSITSLNVLLFAIATIGLPVFWRKASMLSTRSQEIQSQLYDAFDKYMDASQEVYSFEWYCAQINSIALKHLIHQIYCMNCSKKTDWNEYMHYFRESAKVIPELNNFSYIPGKVKFHKYITTLACPKCKKQNLDKIAIKKTSKSK